MEKPSGKGEKGGGTAKKGKKGPSSKSSDDGSEKDKKRRSSLVDSPLTSSSSSSASTGDPTDDAEQRAADHMRPHPSKVQVPSWRGEWMSRFQQCIVNGDHKNFIRRFRMICIALSRRLSHSGRTPDEATVVQMAIKGILSQFYDPSEQTTLIMTLLSNRDVTKTCENTGHGFCRIARMLLKNLQPCDVHAQLSMCTRRLQKTTLHVAASTGDICQMRVLLEHDINVNARDSAGRTALHYALERNHLEMLKLLLWYGADISQCPTGRLHHPPRLLALSLMPTGENIVGQWITDRLQGLERQFAGWVKQFCGNVYHVLESVSELHFIRLGLDAGRPQDWCPGVVHCSNDLNIRKDIHRTLGQPNEVAILFIIPMFYDVRADEHAAAGSPVIARTHLRTLFGGRVSSSAESVQLLPYEPLLVGQGGYDVLEHALHPPHNGFFYSYLLPSQLREGLFTVNLNLNLGCANVNARRVLLAMQAVVCRTIDKSKDKLD